MQSYQGGLEESIKGSEFTFDSADVLYYNLNKISLNRGGSYIDSPEWLKHKKETIIPKNNDDKCFQSALFELNYKSIGHNILYVSHLRISQSVVLKASKY